MGVWCKKGEPLPILGEKPCTNCGELFVYKHQRKQWCSVKCHDAYRHKTTYVIKKPIRGRYRECGYENCSGQVWWYPWQLDRYKVRYCNEGCMAKAMLQGEHHNCSECGKKFYLNPYKHKVSKQSTCSVRCNGLKMRRLAEERNATNPPSQGVLNRRIRYSTKMSEWRKAVFARDDYTCQFCGARNGNGVAVYLQADHIKPFAYFPELRFDLDNGRTLCKPCHKSTPTYGKNVTKLYDSASL